MSRSMGSIRQVTAAYPRPRFLVPGSSTKRFFSDKDHHPWDPFNFTVAKPVLPKICLTLR